MGRAPSRVAVPYLAKGLASDKEGNVYPPKRQRHIFLTCLNKIAHRELYLFFGGQVIWGCVGLGRVGRMVELSAAGGRPNELYIGFQSGMVSQSQ